MKWELVEDVNVAEVDRAADGRPAAHSAPGPSPATDSSRRDLDLIEQLLDRCWREIDSSELNVKLADLVRLLEFKEKLRPAAEAQETFWAIVDRMRREELAHFGESPPDSTHDPETTGDSASAIAERSVNEI